MKSFGNGRRLITTVCCALALTSCGQPSTQIESISQGAATTVAASDSPRYSRVIAIANGSAEIISALGHRSIIVGRDIASTDEDLKMIDIVTSGHQVVAETILAKNPDLVIIDATTGPAPAIEQLRKNGIKVVTISESWSLEDIAGKVGDVSEAIGTPRDGAALIAAMAAAQESASAKFAESGTSARIAFIYLRGTSAIYLIGGKGSGADSLISAIGGTDVGAQALPNPFNPLTAESMATLNPELILVMSKGLESVGGVDGLFALPGIAQTEAGKNKRVIAVDDSLLLSFGPRTPDLLVQLASAVAEKISQ